MPQGLPHAGKGRESSAAAPTRLHIPSLDGIRALAFGVVFVSHANGDRQGMIVVTIFFFLSGYLITTLLRREHDRMGRVSLSGFYLRRCLRILPPLYITIFVILLLDTFHILRVPWSPRSYLAASTFWMNYQVMRDGTHAGLGPFWSLGVEEHFYLLFPLLFIAMNRLQLSYRRQALFLGGLAAAVLVWRILLATGHRNLDQARIFYGTDTRIDSILFGCIMALAFNPVLDRELRPSWIWTALGAIAMIGSVAVHTLFYRETFHYTVQGLALIPLFIAAIRYADSSLRWLNAPAMRFSGTLSYTLYLVHRSFLISASQHIAYRPFAIGLALLASFVYAYGMHQLVETPITLWRQRLSAAMAAPDSPSARLA